MPIKGRQSMRERILTAIRPSRLQYGLWGLVLLMTAIAVAFGLGRWLPTVGFWMLVYAWTATQLAHWLFFGCCVFRRVPSIPRYGMIATGISAAATIIPTLTLLLFLRVFAIGGSSNVAQLAGDSGMDLWSLWFHAWPYLLFANPLALAVTIIAVVFPPYPPQRIAPAATRFVAVVLAVFACHTVLTYFPDA